MLNSSFFKLLNTLSKKEILSFHQFVLGVNAQKKVPNRLLSYVLSKGTNEAAWKKISVEEVYLATFDQVYSSVKHRKKVFNTLAELDALLNNYLIWKEVQQPSMLRQAVLIKIYFKRGLTNRFEKTVKHSVKLVESMPNGFLQPLTLMMFYHFSYFYSRTIDLHKASKLKAAMKCLEQFYLQAKLRYVGELVNRNNLREDNKNFVIPPDLLYKVGKLEHQDNNYMQLYYWIVQLSKKRTVEAYEKVKYYFYTVVFTDKEEEQEILTHLLNFCSYAVRDGDFSYVQEILNIYKKAVAENKLDTYLTGAHFFNIVGYACILKDIDWADSFIDRYSERVKLSNEKDFIPLSKARVFISRKKYEDALIYLIDISSKIFHIEKTRRAFQIKCLVELNENSELILSHCFNFLLYLKRDKFSSKENKLSFINYIMVVQKLQKQVSKDEIIYFIDTASYMAFKNWVSEWIESYTP